MISNFPMALRTLAFAGLTTFLQLTGAFAEELTKIEFCSPFTKLLNAQDLTAKERDDPMCTVSEQVVMSGEDWLQFVSNFRAHIAADGFPVLLYSAFRAEAENETGDAIAYTEDALMNTLFFFDRAREPERGALYDQLIMRHLGALKRREILPRVEWGEAAQDWPHEFHRQLEGAPAEFILQCLLLSDPLIGKVTTILRSERFQSCITRGAEENG